MVKTEGASLEREWAEIRASGRGDGVLEVPSRATAVTTGYGNVRMAIGPRGEPRLLIPVGRPGARSNVSGGRNLLIMRSSFRMADGLEHFIDITLRNSRLSPVFTELVGEIMTRLESGEAPEAALQGTIRDFRNLLAKGPEGEIAPEAVAGLIGELVILERLAGLRADIIDSWTGPVGQRHDFRRRSIAIEVKTSSRSDASRVTIHGSEQLLPPSGGSLNLVHVRLEPVADGALSVESLHRALVEHGVDEVVLDQRLAELGCRDPEAEEWNATRFALEGLDVYDVSPGFPSITPEIFPDGRLPTGIASLSYEIDLSLARAFLLDRGREDALFSDFTS
ncbi:PD-(D/E)XK motif protein [Paenirhodobacter enshiensis]|uniref:PD-(D/E)XK motif protein n=1 Tax=Paenirhodobacter enshiensis TaxID=1105367 RepID=UPI0009DD0CA1|nr:PD-(D/E)XK motif protein [Paenirhodobacter enshiensis]